MKNTIKSGVIFWLIAWVMFFIVWIVYSAWNDTKSSWNPVLASDWNDLVSYTVPSGAIMAFDATCPTWWSEMTEARGRTLVWAGTGGWLTNRALSSTGGTEIVIVPSTWNASASNTPTGGILWSSGGNNIYAHPGWVNSSMWPWSGNEYLDGNLQPYYVITWCKKD